MPLMEGLLGPTLCTGLRRRTTSVGQMPPFIGRPLNLRSGFANHFIYSLVTKSQSNSPSSVGPSSSLQILLAPSLHVQSELSIPTPANGGVSATCLTLVDTSKGTLASGVATSSRMLLTSIPTDKALSQSLGSTIWAVQSDDLGDQVDELVREGRTSDAIGLVNAVGETGFTPVRFASPARRLTKLAVASAPTSGDTLWCPAICPRRLSGCNGGVPRP